MKNHRPLKDFLTATRNLWDRAETPRYVRKTFLSIIICGTIALGAKVYASSTRRRLVYFTCKSRFCSSCGQRATKAWQEELDASLPDIPYFGITCTMPGDLWPLLQENRDLLHCIPAAGANAIETWAESKYGVRLFIVVVQQTFGGFLDFDPHLHIMVSAGGFQVSTNRWIEHLTFDADELMRAWRFAVTSLLAEALKNRLIPTTLFGRPVEDLLRLKYEREWHVDISDTMSKADFLRYAGRYVRRPPIAQYRLRVVAGNKVEYFAKDSRNETFRWRRFSPEKFLHVLMQHVQDEGRHSMRYFGLCAPRSIAHMNAVFRLLGQKRRSKPARKSHRASILETFGYDPLIDDNGEEMKPVKTNG